MYYSTGQPRCRIHNLWCIIVYFYYTLTNYCCHGDNLSALKKSCTVTNNNHSKDKILDRKNPRSIFRSNVKAVDAVGGQSVLQKRWSKLLCTWNSIKLFNSGHPMVLLPWWWWPWTWRRLRQCELIIYCVEMRRMMRTVSQCELFLLSYQQFNWDASDPGFTDDFYQTMMANYRCLFKTIYIWYYKCKLNLFTFLLCEIQNSGPTSMLKARVLL